MPRSVDLFIASQDPLETVAQAVGGIEGVRLTARDGTWQVQDGEVHAVLGAHVHSSDHEVPLGGYQYVASAEVPDTVRPQDSAQAALLRKVAQRLQDGPSTLVLMVLDLQYRGNADQPEVPA